MDFYFGLPEFKIQDELERELEIFRNIDKAGLVISQEIAPFSDMIPVFETGEKLIRLSGMSRSGVEIDIHGLGINNLLLINKLTPGFIRRVKTVKSYEEY